MAAQASADLDGVRLCSEQSVKTLLSERLQFLQARYSFQTSKRQGLCRPTSSGEPVGFLPSLRPCHGIADRAEGIGATGSQSGARVSQRSTLARERCASNPPTAYLAGRWRACEEERKEDACFLPKRMSETI